MTTALSKKAINAMKEWLMKNMEHPFPSDETKKQFKANYRIRDHQIEAWFDLARKVMDSAKYGDPPEIPKPKSKKEARENLKRAAVTMEEWFRNNPHRYMGWFVKQQIKTQFEITSKQINSWISRRVVRLMRNRQT